MGISEVKLLLQSHPEFSAGSEIAGKAKGGIGSDIAAPAEYVTDSSWRNMEFHCKAVGIEVYWLHPVLSEDFSGMNGGKVLHLMRPIR